MVGEQQFRGHLVHVARLRVGPFLNADGVLVENLGGGVFNHTRQLSHGERDVTPTPICTSPSLPQATNRTTTSGRPGMVPCPT